MKVRAGELVQLLMVAAAFYIAYYFYPALPERMASHWGAGGNVNGWMPKAAAMYFMPGMSAFLFLVFFITARVSVKGRDISGFRGTFEIFAFVTLAFTLYVFCLVIAFNMKISFDMGAALAPGIAALFFSAGKLMEKSSANYFVGIRTAWTMQNEKVWDKTHKRGAKLFYAASCFILAGALFPGMLLFFMVVPLVVIPFYLADYSKKAYNDEISRDEMKKYLDGQ